MKAVFRHAGDILVRGVKLVIVGHLTGTAFSYLANNTEYGARIFPAFVRKTDEPG